MDDAAFPRAVEFLLPRALPLFKVLRYFRLAAQATGLVFSVEHRLNAKERVQVTYVRAFPPAPGESLEDYDNIAWRFGRMIELMQNPAWGVIELSNSPVMLPVFEDLYQCFCSSERECKKHTDLDRVYLLIRSEDEGPHVEQFCDQFREYLAFVGIDE